MTADRELPTVSVCMISYNDEKIIGDALESIFAQDYPPDKLEVLIADGGSTDRTPEIIRKTRARVIVRPDLKDEPYRRGELMMGEPKTDIVIAFSADNRFQERHALRRLVAPFSDPEIAGSETMRYGLRPEDPPLSRYFALIGGGDTIAVALGTADRSPYDTEKWIRRGHAEDKGEYFKVSFEPDPLKVSTLGANGFAYRKAYLDKIGGQSLGLHSEACLKLIEAGYKFAVVKHCHVIHLMTTSLWSFVKRRILWARVYSHDKLPRTYRVYDPRRDWLKLLGICVSFLTLVVPTLRALKGYARYRDPAWFLHPLVGLVFTVGYGLMVLQGAFSRKATAGNV